MTIFYFLGSTWSGLQHTSTELVAFPFGMDPNVFAGLDGLTYFVAGAINAVTGNPYVGLNLILLASFPIVAVLSYAAIRLVGLSGPMAVVLANAFTFIPFHFGRGIGHLHLGLMFGLVTGVLLSLLIGSGRLAEWSRSPHPRRWVYLTITLLLIATTAWTGLYFAFFGVVLLVAAIAWRISSADRWRELWPGVTALIGLLGAIGLGLIPILTSRESAPEAALLALRDPMDSVTYAGNLAISVIPQPYSIISSAYNEAVFSMFGQAPANEAHLMANFGTWVTSAALIVFLIGLAGYRRERMFKGVAPVRSTTSRPATAEGSSPATAPITYITYLMVLVMVLFVPWGLNYIFAYLGTAQIRAWNRLLPYLLFLMILGASAALSRWGWPRRTDAAWVVSVLVVAATVVEMVLPWRNLYVTVPADASVRVQQGYDYAAQVNAALPDNCGVLALPYVSYPGAGPVAGMDDYDHFTLGLTNPEKPISYGAYRGFSAATTLENLSQQPIAQSRRELTSLGFCGVHVDARGYDDASPILNELTTALGEPVASVGSWTMFQLTDG